MDIRILGNLLRETIDQGNLRDRHHQVIQKVDFGQTWSSQEWKSGAAAHDRSGKHERTSWDMMQQGALHREEPLLDGSAHSVRYGEMIHDGSGKTEKVNSQEGADSKTFVM